MTQQRWSWNIVPLLLLLLGAVWVGLSPSERVLGQGIKMVYVHVACIWVGLVAFALWGVLGWFSMITKSLAQQMQPWVRALGWMAVSWFALGVGTSMLAAKINWGAVYWAEPRLKMALLCWMSALAIHTLNLWIPWPRLEGFLAGLPGVAILLSLWITPLVLHPRQPFMGKEATSFLTAFVGLFVIALALAGWLTVRIANRGREQT